MTNAAALGGASSSCRGGAVRGGGGRQRTTSVSESPDALRQWLTVAMAPDWLSLQAAHRGLRGVFGGPKKRRAWHPSFDTVGVLALRSPPADHFASRQEERLQRPWPGCRATVVQPDGARRWDDVYPCLLPWAMEHDAGSRPASAPPQGAVASRVSSGRCMMLRMRNGGDTAARPWPRTSGPGVPSAGDGAAKPRAAVARGGRGPARPPALALRPTVLGIPAAGALTRSQLPWWSPWLPGRPPPDRRPAGRQSPSASARPRSPRPGVETAGRAPRDGACGARRPPREAPPGAGPAPRRLASVHRRPQRRR